MDAETNWSELIETCSGDVRRLTSVWRFSSIPIAVPENVADHSWFVTLYAALIHRFLEPWNNDLLGPILLHAVLHDVPECISGDVVRVFKYTTPELKQEIDKAEKILVNKFPEQLKDLVKLDAELISGKSTYAAELESNKNYVEAVVKAADFMSSFQFMKREAMRSNLEIIPFYNRFLADLTLLSQGKNQRDFKPKEFYLALREEALEIGKSCFKNVDHWEYELKATI